MKNYQAQMHELRAGNYAPVYFLEGEEGFFIDRISGYIEEHALDEAGKAFDLNVVYGRDSDVDNILGMAREFPLGGERKVLIVKEAQHLKNIERISAYLKNVQTSTVLVFCYKYKKLDRRKPLAKELGKSAVLYTANKLKDYEIPDMAAKYLKSKKRNINASNARTLADHLGNDLGRLVNELDKLLIITQPGEEITAKIIEENIGISKDFNIFELQKALGTRSAERAFSIAKHFAANPKEHPLVLTVSMLYSYFNKLMAYHYLPDKNQASVAKVLKMNPYFVKDTAAAASRFSRGKLVRIHGVLREYDLKSKGLGNTSTDQGELLRELVYKLLN